MSLREPDWDRIRELHDEQFRLEREGRWTKAEYDRLVEEIHKVSGGDGDFLSDFAQYEPGLHDDAEPADAA